MLSIVYSRDTAGGAGLLPCLVTVRMFRVCGVELAVFFRAVLGG